MKTFLFVDGSNLYGAQFKFFGPKNYLDFSIFIKLLEKGLKTNFDEIYFYASYSPKPARLKKNIKEYLKNEGLFYRGVKNTKRTTFFKGYRSPTSGKEKEVDVKITADIVRFGFEKKFNKMYLLTGDADFLQALFAIQNLKVGIEIISIENQVMHKGAFYYPTTIVDFVPNKLSLKFHPKQKIKLLEINRSDVSKKIPQMHASRVD